MSVMNKKYIKEAKNIINSNKNMKIIGITGSYGKTSTKNIINEILSESFSCIMTPKSFNTTLGVTKCIRENIKPYTEVFICEMGAARLGEIKEICEIVKPNFSVITSIGPQHLTSFKTMENIQKAKFEIVENSSQGSVSILNIDNNYIDEGINLYAMDKKVIKYAIENKDEADYYAENIETGERGSTFDVVIPGKESIKIKTRLLGKLNILNVVCAVAVADKLGLSPEEIKVGAKYLRPVPHRLELRQNPNGSIIIDDAYNSNIRGASMALEVLKSFENKKRILITPGIVDLGDKAKEINKELGNKAAEASDFIILVGAKQAIPIFEGIREKKYPEKNVYIANNLEDALRKMNQIIDSNSVVLLENDLPDNYL